MDLYMQRPNSFMLLPHPSATTPPPPLYLMRNATTVPPSPPYHMYHLQYPACVPPMYYGLPSRPYQPFILPIAPHQEGTPLRQHRAYIPQWQNPTYLPPWQNRAYVLPGQRRANVQPWTCGDNGPPWQHRTNIPPWTRYGNVPPWQHRAITAPQQHQANLTSLEGEYENTTPVFDTGEVRPWLSVDVDVEANKVQQRLSHDSEVKAFEVQRWSLGEAEVTISYQLRQQENAADNVTQNGGTSTAKFAIEFLPSVLRASDAEVKDCPICMNEMCPEERDEMAKLPCGHLFHRDCIMLWLCNHNTCPMCVASTSSCPAPLE